MNITIEQAARILAAHDYEFDAYPTLSAGEQAKWNARAAEVLDWMQFGNPTSA